MNKNDKKKIRIIADHLDHINYELGQYLRPTRKQSKSGLIRMKLNYVCKNLWELIERGK